MRVRRIVGCGLAIVFVAIMLFNIINEMNRVYADVGSGQLQNKVVDVLDTPDTTYYILLDGPESFYTKVTNFYEIHFSDGNWLNITFYVKETSEPQDYAYILIKTYNGTTVTVLSDTASGSSSIWGFDVEVNMTNNTLAILNYLGENQGIPANYYYKLDELGIYADYVTYIKYYVDVNHYPDDYVSYTYYYSTPSTITTTTTVTSTVTSTVTNTTTATVTETLTLTNTTTVTTTTTIYNTTTVTNTTTITVTENYTVTETQTETVTLTNTTTVTTTIYNTTTTTVTSTLTNTTTTTVYDTVTSTQTDTLTTTTYVTDYKTVTKTVYLEQPKYYLMTVTKYDTITLKEETVATPNYPIVLLLAGVAVITVIALMATKR